MVQDDKCEWKRGCNDVGFLFQEDRVVIVVGLVKTEDPMVGWNELEETLKGIGQTYILNDIKI